MEDDVDPGLLLQPQLQKPQRHLCRPGELLRIPRSYQLAVTFALSLWEHPVFLRMSSSAMFLVYDYVQGIFCGIFSYWKNLLI